MHIVPFFVLSITFSSTTGAETDHLIKGAALFSRFDEKGRQEEPSENRKSNTPPIFGVTSISCGCVSYPLSFIAAAHGVKERDTAAEVSPLVAFQRRSQQGGF